MKICSIKNCGKRHSANGYCSKHDTQMRMYGKILERTIFDKNEYFDRGEYMEMALYNHQNKIVAYTKFDKEDLEKIRHFKWYYFIFKYVARGYKNKIFLMHREIIDVPKMMQIDHINGDGLDNRKNNLRIATHGQNMMNKNKPKPKSSIYKGVFSNKLKNKWYSQIAFNYKSYHIGSFDNERHAAMAYDIWAKELFGEFAFLNFKSV